MAASLPRWSGRCWWPLWKGTYLQSGIPRKNFQKTFKMVSWSTYSRWTKDSFDAYTTYLAQKHHEEHKGQPQAQHVHRVAVSGMENISLDSAAITWCCYLPPFQDLPSCRRLLPDFRHSPDFAFFKDHPSFMQARTIPPHYPTPSFRVGKPDAILCSNWNVVKVSQWNGLAVKLAVGTCNTCVFGNSRIYLTVTAANCRLWSCEPNKHLWRRHYYCHSIFCQFSGITKTRPIPAVFGSNKNYYDRTRRDFFSCNEPYSKCLPYELRTGMITRKNLHISFPFFSLRLPRKNTKCFFELSPFAKFCRELLGGNSFALVCLEPAPPPQIDLDTTTHVGRVCSSH